MRGTHVLNNQKPEARERLDDGSTLDIIEVFPTIQGEGPFAGRSCVFVRLAGCNLQCPWCDTQYTEGRVRRTIPALLDDVFDVRPRHSKLVIITGGEPLRQNITPFCTQLVSAGLEVQIESNGTLSLPNDLRLLLMTQMVHLIVSPKTSKINPFIYKHAMAFKYVIEDGQQDESDGLPTVALGHKATPRVARPPAEYNGPIYVNPMDSKDPQANSNNMAACVSATMKFGYTLGLQMHKIINMP